MVVQKTIDNLKNGPKEDKVAVASGVAVTVVVVLLVCWAIFFFRGLRNNKNINFSGAQDQFNFQNVKDAQQQIQQQLTSSSQSDMQAVHDESAGGQLQIQQQSVQQQMQGSGSDQFGNSNVSQ